MEKLAQGKVFSLQNVDLWGKEVLLFFGRGLGSGSSSLLFILEYMQKKVFVGVWGSQLEE